MRKFVAFLVYSLVMLVFISEAFANFYVRGYTRRDGTYVQPHYRSSPDNSYNNNWSVSPNVNPRTGQQGARQPTWNDRPPASGYGSGFGNSLDRPDNPYSTNPYRR